MEVGVITQIEAQKRKPGRVNIFVDEEFWTGMPEEVMLEHNLREGGSISRQQQVEIEQQVAEESALAAATHLLSYRDRSEHEMRQRLMEKGYGKTVVEVALQKLQEYNYLDDKLFAEQLASDCLVKGKGRRAAEFSLSRAGVDKEIAQEALDAAYSSGSELESALEWLRRKPVPTDYAQRAKLLRALSGRGFNFDVAQEALDARQAEA